MDESLLRKFHKELSAGTVSLALLAVVAAGSEAMYGYQIAKRLEQLGDGVLAGKQSALYPVCLLYTSPSPRDRTRSRMPSSA